MTNRNEDVIFNNLPVITLAGCFLVIVVAISAEVFQKLGVGENGAADHTSGCCCEHKK